MHVIWYYALYFCVQFEEWEQHYGLLGGCIKTQTTPRIFYLPKSHNKKTAEQLDATKLEIQGVYVHGYDVVGFIINQDMLVLPSCEMHRLCNIFIIILCPILTSIRTYFY